jgi:exodeoxyribonuclease V alpha subunit
VLAEWIVGAFGEGTFEVIEASLEKLREVAGIGEFPGKIAAGWAEQRAVRDIMVFLHSHGVGTSRAVRIFETSGHDAIQVMPRTHIGSPVTSVASAFAPPTRSP